jgi:uncharacterized protein YbbC (DUF1343 family)
VSEAATSALRIGVDLVGSGEESLPGRRVGVVTNPTGVDHALIPTAAVLQRAGVDVTALFAPEHGIGGAAQAGEGNALRDPDFPDIAVYDTYKRDSGGVTELVRESGVEQLVFDIQDVGARFYTYSWTMFDCLVAAARLGIPFTVLDRPNPISGAVSEGVPADRPWISTFVGRVPIPARHGLTTGELATYLNSSAVTEWAGRPADLRVVAVRGWRREDYLDAADAGYPWVLPSPNLPTLDSALVYPGTCFFEGTNLSEGRGTTRPFELVGAPFVDGRLAAALNERKLPGVWFRSTSFEPTQSKFAGELVRGVQVHVRDRAVFRPVLTGLTMLDAVIELYADQVSWRTFGERYAIDSLWGTEALRESRDAGRALADLAGPVTGPGDWAQLAYRAAG